MTDNNKTGLIRKFICIVFIGLVLAFVGIGIYIGYVVSNASVPAISVAGSRFQVNQNGTANIASINGTATVNVQNKNKVALTINGASFPAFYPSSSANTVLPQKQVGSVVLPQSVVNSDSNGSITFDMSVNPPFVYGAGMIVEQVSGATNIYVNGSTVGSAVIAILRYNVPISFSCKFSINAITRNADPQCQVNTGTAYTSTI